LVFGSLPAVVEEIFATGFVGEEEEGKAFAADKIAASCRQNLCVGQTPCSTNSH
jgi:hypothetical protein